jgi:hypothetical protein
VESIQDSGLGRTAVSFHGGGAVCEREEGKKEKEEGDVAADLQDPLASVTGAGEVLGGRLVGCARAESGSELKARLPAQAMVKRFSYFLTL